ncbi:MAG: transposase [Planctomycetaceae bacterium]
MSRSRRFPLEEKTQIVRRQLAGKEAVSALAEEFGLQPGQIHARVHTVRAQAGKVFERSPENGRSEKLQCLRIELLEAELPSKDDFISELLDANVEASKSLGRRRRTDCGRAPLNRSWLPDNTRDQNVDHVHY